MNINTITTVDLDSEETERLMNAYLVCNEVIDWLEDPFEDRMNTTPHAEAIKSYAESTRHALYDFMNFMGVDVEE